MVSAGKAILLHRIVIVAQPPMSEWGMPRATMLARNVPISRPRCVFGSVKTIMQAPNAAINNPMPISARADQWHIGKLLATGP